MTTAWKECAMCQDYICTIHEEHVSDCECPGIGTWVEAGYSPYDTQVTDEVKEWVKAHPFIDE